MGNVVFGICLPVPAFWKALSQTPERNRDKFVFFRIKNFCISRDSSKKTKRQPPQDGRKIATRSSDRDLGFWSYKELLNLLTTKHLSPQVLKS